MDAVRLRGLIDEHVRAHGLIPHGGEALCLVSGGADSTCLVHSLRALGYQAAALHVARTVARSAVCTGCP